MYLPQSKAITALERFCHVHKERDLPALLGLFTRNCNVWGTCVDEYRVGLKQLEEQCLRDWSQSEKCEIQIVSLVSTSKEALWAAGVFRALVTIDNVQHVFEHLRGTIIIEKEEGEWKIAHMHSSFPDYRGQAENSFPLGFTA